MRYARIEGGTAVEFVETDGDIAKMFHPSLQFVPAPPGAELGWVLDGGDLDAPPPPPPPTVDELSAYAADARWRKEIGGVAVAGVPVATDDRSKQMIIGARIAADSDPGWTSQWVGADGSIYPLDAAAVIAISNAVQAHVNACFATYASVKTEIDAGTITTMQEIDAAFAD
ncbi:MAG: DUF4376 domain-containing protein [Xanthobacteraceae bacterium]